MVPRLSSELIQSLRLTLQKIDDDFPSPADEHVVEQLKRLLVLRLAELEAAHTSNPTDKPTEGAESAPVVAVRMRSE